MVVASSAAQPIGGVEMRVARMVTLLSGLVLAASARSAADQYVAYVPSPNGTDDTAAIQGALDTCVQQHPRACTVQLVAGTYRTRQLVAYNFHGVFKGLGADRTTIEALPQLPVTIDFFQPCQPNTTTCLWPTLMIFVDGDISISDLSIHMTATDGTATDPPGQIETGIRFMGRYSTTDAHIDRIQVEGRRDSTGPLGYNVTNGIMYTGELSATSGNPIEVPCGAAGGFYFLSGSYTVRNSSFKSMGDGVSLDGCVRSSHVTIGGSPTAGNTFEDHFVGIDMESAEDSNVEISYNASSGSYYSMWVVPWISSIFVPRKASQYLVHDNEFVTTEAYGTGILLYNDTPDHPWIDAVIWNNSIQLQNALSDGIDVFNTRGTTISNGSITGSGYDAIGLWGSTSSTLIHNDVSDYSPDASFGRAQIYLDPATSRDVVVCSTSADSVLNEGRDSVVVGCQRPATESEARSGAPRGLVPHPRLQKAKPSPYRP
jgi:pectate lyase-like protein